MALVATLIANPANPVLTAEIAKTVMEGLSSQNVDWLAEGIACDFPLSDTTKKTGAETFLSSALSGLPIDFAIQESTTRRKKALIADMDSTMIDQECIDELADEVGFGKDVAAITARAMNGEIAFEPALRERVALLRNLPLSVIDRVLADRITLASGARQLVATMKANGAYTALVSGGFTRFTEAIAAQLGFDEHRANTLEEAGSVLTGKVREPILGREAKAEAIAQISLKRGLDPADFIAVGDGANDLAMLAIAGSGVAVHAKPVVAAKASIRIDHGDLTSLLYLQGYRVDEIVT